MKNFNRSLVTLPGRHFREPQFAAASFRFAEAIADELLRAADIARPHWAALAEMYSDELPSLRVDASYQTNLFRLPLVANFTRLWVEAMNWPLTRIYDNGFVIQIPDEILAELHSSSSVGLVDLFLGAFCEVVSGRCDRSDRHCDYRISLNAPTWILLAASERAREWFAGQIRMILHHEMGHFRWQGSYLRAEHVAHARGIARLLAGDVPKSPSLIGEMLEAQCPGAWNNPEIRSLIGETKGGARLVHAWASRGRRLQGLEPRNDGSIPLETSVA